MEIWEGLHISGKKLLGGAQLCAYDTAWMLIISDCVIPNACFSQLDLKAPYKKMPQIAALQKYYTPWLKLSKQLDCFIFLTNIIYLKTKCSLRAWWGLISWDSHIKKCLSITYITAQ